MFKITKFNLCVIGMFVGIGLNIQRQVSLEMNQPGLNYLFLAVQFADGTSGVYSGVMDVDAFSSKSQGENYLDYQLDETDSETGKSFKQWQLETPPFNNPLDKQSDKAEWWRIHSPLYLHTAALGA